MNLRSLFVFLLFALLCTCGPAEKDCENCNAEEKVERLERVYHAAYQDQDAAVLQRLLSDAFVAMYPDQSSTKNKEEFIGEMAQFRLIFPELTITVDSSKITEYQGNYFVRGTRHFTWKQEREPGIYRESFANQWQQQPDGWFLASSTFQSLQPR